jgi:nucleotide-binding universal stress UspA family protein
VTVRTIDTVPGGTGPALLAVAAEENADWMVMGAYGHRLLMGSCSAR